VRRLTSKTVDKKTFKCPQCGEYRMLRPIDFEYSLEKQEYKTRDGSSVSLHVNTCDKCQRKNFKLYFEPSKADIRRVLKGLHDTSTKLEEGESLEELL